MKRKRGQRGGKKLKIKQTTESNSNNDNNPNISTSESESEPEPVNKPISKPVIKTQPELDPILVPISKPQTQAVYSRVRVKIKSPISVPISNSSSISNSGPISVPISNSSPISVPISNSSPISVPTAAPISEKTNLGANTMPKLINTFSRKFGGIKIKTNKNVTPGGSKETGTDKEVTVPVQVPEPVQVSECNYDEAELNSALAVIKKIMKMEAAAPFNEPVDPVALGIPDYFDVIETPMDFGTICKEIEKGPKCKYKNSQDVYKDIQLIWQNCYKYNNKGDYVIDLMRRVKKNFSKYWGAAGLSTSNNENGQNEDGSSEKNQKGKLKQQKKKKRSTMDHRSDCLCAVCVIRRRKLEKDNDSPTINLEEKSPGTSSPIGRDQSMDYNNNTEEKKKKEIRIKSQNSNFGKDKIALCTNNQASQVLSSESDDSEENNENENDENNIINDDNNDASSQPEEGGNKVEVVKKNEILVENHSVLELCKSVFDDRSRWTGSTALVRRGPGSVSYNDNPFHSAIASLLKL